VEKLQQFHDVATKNISKTENLNGKKAGDYFRVSCNMIFN